MSEHKIPREVAFRLWREVRVEIEGSTLDHDRKLVTVLADDLRKLLDAYASLASISDGPLLWKCPWRPSRQPETTAPPGQA